VISTGILLDVQSDNPRIPMQVTSGCLVASIQVDLTAGLLRQFQRDLLERIRDTGVSGVILDVSGVEIMDLDDFELLRRSMSMASIMGARPMLVGLRPGIVASLLELGSAVDGVEAAADLDDALQRLRETGKDDTPPSADGGAREEEAAGGSREGEDADDGADDSHRDQR
jgi:rsbT antagonist protein RsbS